MLSQLELCQIVESGFYPMKGVCSIDPDGTLTVKLFHPLKGHAALIACGIPVEGLETSRAISELIAKLKSELQEKEAGSMNAHMTFGAKYG